MRRTTIITGAALLSACIVSWSDTASAQQPKGESYLASTLPAPSRTFELKLGTGYTQGFGNIAPGRGIPSAAGAGLGLALDADYRIVPAASVGIETQYQQFATNNNNGSYGLAVNVGTTYHFTPQRQGDFWARLGAGYRLLWDVDPFGAVGTTDLYHGITVATVKLGYDVRTSSDIAIAPVLGADLQTFIWKDADRFGTPQWGSFIYAGVQGRFDMMARSRGGVVVTSAGR